MVAPRRQGLEKPAIDPVFAILSFGSDSAGRTARRQCDPDSSPLIEAFAMRHRTEPRSAFPVFPTARPELLFHFGDPFQVRDDASQPWRELPRATLLGPRRHRYWQSAGPLIDWFLVQLTPLGCRRFLGAPLGVWWNVDVALADLWGDLADTLYTELATELDFGSRRALTLAALGGLALDAGGDEAISRASQYARGGLLRTPADLAREIGIGERRLRQRFAAEFGWSPKAYLNLLRFNRHMVEAHPLYPAMDFGPVDHADQSHAIHEFRRFTGMTPGAYARLKAQGDPLIVTGSPQPA